MNVATPNTKILPIINETLNVWQIKKNKEHFSPENYNNIIKTNYHRLSANLVVGFSTSLSAYSISNNNFEDTHNLIQGAITVGLAITGILANQIKNAKYEETVKRVQNELSKDFRVRFNTKTFEELATGDIYAQAEVSSKILNCIPFIGPNEFTKKVNKWYNQAIKLNKKYMKNNGVESFMKDYNKTTSAFIENLYQMNSEYNSKKITIKKKNENNITQKLVEHYINQNWPSKGSRKKIMEDLNETAIKKGYQMSLIQDTQLAFVNTLKLYAKEKLSQNPNPENVDKYKKQLKKFKELYEQTDIEQREDIPEYYSFKNVIDSIDKFSNIEFVKEISEESFEATVKRFNENLSNGKDLYLRTVKDNILRCRNLIIENENDKKLQKEFIAPDAPVKQVKVNKNVAIKFDNNFEAKLEEAKEFNIEKKQKPITYNNKKIKNPLEEFKNQTSNKTNNKINKNKQIIPDDEFIKDIEEFQNDGEKSNNQIFTHKGKKKKKL